MEEEYRKSKVIVISSSFPRKQKTEYLTNNIEHRINIKNYNYFASTAGTIKNIQTNINILKKPQHLNLMIKGREDDILVWHFYRETQENNRPHAKCKFGHEVKLCGGLTSNKRKHEIQFPTI